MDQVVTHSFEFYSSCVVARVDSGLRHGVAPRLLKPPVLLHRALGLGSCSSCHLAGHALGVGLRTALGHALGAGLRIGFCSPFQENGLCCPDAAQHCEDGLEGRQGGGNLLPLLLRPRM